MHRDRLLSDCCVLVRRRFVSILSVVLMALALVAANAVAGNVPAHREGIDATSTEFPSLKGSTDEDRVLAQSSGNGGNGGEAGGNGGEAGGNGGNGGSGGNGGNGGSGGNGGNGGSGNGGSGNGGSGNGGSGNGGGGPGGVTSTSRSSEPHQGSNGYDPESCGKNSGQSCW